MRLSSKKLLDYIDTQNNVVEAYLQGSGFRATHYLTAENITHFWHEGIDGEEELISKDDFMELYPKAIWIIEESENE